MAKRCEFVWFRLGPFVLDISLDIIRVGTITFELSRDGLLASRNFNWGAFDRVLRSQTQAWNLEVT